MCIPTYQFAYQGYFHTYQCTYHHNRSSAYYMSITISSLQITFHITYQTMFSYHKTFHHRISALHATYHHTYHHLSSHIIKHIISVFSAHHTTYHHTYQHFITYHQTNQQVIILHTLRRHLCIKFLSSSRIITVLCFYLQPTISHNYCTSKANRTHPPC